VKIDISSGTVSVRQDGNAEAILKAINDAGYPATPA
jgi:copper chaperone CopZ